MFEGRQNQLRTFLLLTLGTKMMFACTPQPKFNEIILTPTNPSISYDSNNEFCAIPTAIPGALPAPTIDPVDQARLGTPVASEEFFVGDINTLKATKISRENILSLTEVDWITRHQTILIPVGYSASEIEQVMPEMIAKLNLVFSEVNIDFSWLNFSLPIGLKNIDRHVTFTTREEAEIAFNKIQGVVHADDVIFVVNSSMYGGSGGYFPIATVGHDASLFVVSHEEAHKLGLGDGELKESRMIDIPNTELFYSLDQIGTDPIFANAYTQTNPPIIPVGRCNGTPVYRFYDNKNLMNHYWSDSELMEKIVEGGSAFTPFQIAYMNEFIKAHK